MNPTDETNDILRSIHAEMKALRADFGGLRDQFGGLREEFGGLRVVGVMQDVRDLLREETCA
jgi:hypothetical protein